MARSMPSTPGIRVRGSTLNRSLYVSADEDSSETETGDINVEAARIELIDSDGDSPKLIDLTGDDFDGRRDTTQNFTFDFTQHDSVQYARTPFDDTVAPGDCVECTYEADQAFLRIVRITRSQGEIYLHGDLLQRTGDVDKKLSKAGGKPLKSLMRRYKNEVCALLRVRSGSTTSLGKALVTRHIGEVRIVRQVIFTNRSRNEFKGEALGEQYTKEEWRQKEDKGTLFCRRKYIEVMDTQRKQVVSYQICWIDQKECSPDCSVPEEQVFITYRPTSTGTAESPKGKRQVIEISSDDDTLEAFEKDYSGRNARRAFAKKKKKFRESTETIEFENGNGEKEVLTYQVTERRTTSRRPSKKFIFADLCAGGGGTSTGAKLAGLQLKYLLDFESDCCKTLKLNFGAVMLEMDISAFSTNDTSGATGGDHVDVMHVSFPCQGHSSANTGINEELDSVRIATAYGTLENILKKCRPRVLTLEQVPGMLWKKDGQHFRAQVHALTEAGYSLRWKVVNFALYGNSQARKRVIVIAACPGQILPPFPAPTHGPGLKPFVTVADVLAGVPHLRLNDQMAYSIRRDARMYLPWNANLPLRNCITGDGGAGNWHPSGTRTFSYQEKSQLQGFPATHKYYASSKKSLGKQIGNAVPPIFAKALFEAVIPCLEETDENMKKWRLDIAEKKAHAARHPIVID